MHVSTGVTNTHAMLYDNQVKAHVGKTFTHLPSSHPVAHCDKTCTVIVSSDVL